MTNASSYLQDYYNGINTRKETAAQGLRKAFLHLKQRCPRLQRIKINYEGYDDNGWLESILFWDGSDYFDLSDDLRNDPLPITVVNQSLPYSPELNASAGQALDQYAWDVACEQNPGFEINEGGYGAITIEVEPDADLTLENIKVHLEHCERVEHVNEYSYDL
jgi:hypothetical protein